MGCALDRVMRGDAVRGNRGTVLRQVMQATAGMLGLADLLRLGFRGRVRTDIGGKTNSRQRQTETQDKCETKKALYPKHPNDFSPDYYIL
jgi:hypothetical protein